MAQSGTIERVDIVTQQWNTPRWIRIQGGMTF